MTETNSHYKYGVRTPSKRMRRRSSLAVVAVVTSMVLAACGGSPAGEDQIEIVATTTIVADIVENVVGDAANVITLMPLGTDPHDFQPSSAQVADLSQADLVVANGLGLEEGLIGVLESAEADGVNILYLAPGVDPLPFSQEDTRHHEDDDHSDHEDEEGDHDEDHSDHEDEEGDHDEDHSDHEDEDGGHDHGSKDPHFWLDPVRVVASVGLIVAALGEIDDSVDWASSADAYVEELMALDAEIEATLADVSTRVLVTNHDSFGYFAARYDFEVAGTVIPGGSTGGAPSSAELADLVAVILAEQVSAIFAETTASTELADAVAAEVGAQIDVVELFTGSLGGPGSGGESYVEMMRTNAQRISDGLTG